MIQKRKQAAWLLYGVTQLAVSQTVAPMAAPMGAKSGPIAPATPVVVVQGDEDVARARNSAMAKTVVTAEALSKYGDFSITDALARVAGVSVVQGTVQLRGLGSRYTQILIDGDRPPGGFTLSSLSLSNVHRVEILRVATAEYGTQAIGGTINIILKKIAKPPAGRVRIGMENGYRPAANFDLQGSQTRGSLGLSLGILAQERRSPFSTPQQTEYTHYSLDGLERDQGLLSRRGKSASRLVSATPRLVYKVDESLTLTSNTFLSGSNSKGSRTEAFEVLAGTPDILQSSYRDFSRSAHSASTSVSILKQLGNAKIDGKFSISSNSSEGSSNNFVQNLTTSEPFQRIQTSAGGSGRDASLKYSRRTTKDHQIAVGASASRISGRNSSFTVQHFISDEIAEFSSSTVASNALFAQDEWDLNAGSSVYFGLRWERLSVKGATGTSQSQRYSSAVWSPIIQGLWKLDNKVSQVRLAVSRTYKAPDSLMLLTPVERNLNNSALLPSFRGNIALKPELAWSIDSAYEYAKPDGVDFNIRSSIKRINNLQRLSTSNVNGVWELMYVNRGVGRSFGVEADFRVSLPVLLAGAPDIGLGASVGKTWSRVDAVPGPDNTLEPRATDISLNADYTAKKIPLSMGISFRYSPSATQRLSLVERIYETPNRSLDMYGAWKFNRTSQLRLSVSNLLRPDSSSIRQFDVSNGQLEAVTSSSGYFNTKLVFESKF